MTIESAVRSFTRIAGSVVPRALNIAQTSGPSFDAGTNGQTGSAARVAASAPAAGAVSASWVPDSISRDNAEVEHELTLRLAAMAGWGPTLRLKLLCPSPLLKSTAVSLVLVPVAVLVGHVAGLEPGEVIAWMSGDG